MSLFHDRHYSKSIRPKPWLHFQSNFIGNLQQNSNKYHFAPRRVSTDIILTIGGGLQSLNEYNSSTAAMCSDESTCCNLRYGTNINLVVQTPWGMRECSFEILLFGVAVPPASNTAKLPRIPQGVRTNNPHLRFDIVSYGRTP